MILHLPTADGPLSGLVDVFWYFDTSADPASPAHRRGKEKVLPTGTFEFVFNLGDDRIHVYERGNAERPLELSGAITCGVHSEYFMLDRERRGRVAGVHFKPGGAYPLLRRSAADFANRHVDLVEILGPAVTAFRRDLAQLTAPQRLFGALETFLTEKLDRRRRLSAAVAGALRMLDENPFCNPVPTLQSEFEITQKGLIGAFKRQVGLTPKTFSRVLRFQEVLKRIVNGRNPDWADIALRCGYYDQAHFGRDFKRFSGFSPGEYRARAGPNPNHVSAT